MSFPFLHTTHITIPKRASTMTRSLNRSSPASRLMTASMPRTPNSVPLVPSVDYTSLERMEKISFENKVDDLLNGVPFRTIEPETIPGLIIVMKERKRKAGLTNNYALSQTITDMISRLISLKFQIKVNAMKQQQIKELNAVIEQSKKELEALRAKWDERIQKFNEEQSKAAKDMEEEHIKQLENFDNSIPTDLPPQYCKLSPDLLNMMDIERRLVLTKEYEQARTLKIENEKRKEKETEEQKKKFLAVIEKQRKAIITDQEHAIECFTARWTREAEKLNNQKDKEITTQQKVVDHYEQDLKNLTNTY
ncbi:hypothetical protein TVAG_076580 [Trichomonas vaginalis G3]|uniref:Uncharacterized protein n=1 Tax=Trichomonas vaginalis (strain ATCC PRA-98 / G3) TaxID=412133 RepID=A2D9Q5_TRIV3|nr:hypothetical protein TVAGG3_0292230 [Trichomonas vaginalis G3]EAY22911.1 hypothetical protein TVAG_076580 [Trichomonas vaginalis G3]KAI5527363.1 hypothetical protein TVAGG3_0292230 [Trichomonas vaginalis G3]|eukprot:XP_001583897.1 hypothetical protein [Trichomonas vaginalis G3]